MYICSIIYYLYIVYIKKRFITLKDFEITPNENVIEWNPNFYSCIDKMKQFGCKSYRGKVEWLFKCQNICRKRICQPIPAIVNFTNKNEGVSNAN